MVDTKPIILSEKEIEEKLKKLPHWSHRGDKLVREIKFATFVDGINFINQLVPFFENIDHHADMHIYYTKIVFELQRFDVGGKITDRDFSVAHEIEKEVTRSIL